MFLTIKKSFQILKNNKRKLPFFLVLFCVLAVVDLLGIGLLGPYITIVMDESKINQVPYVSFIIEALQLEISIINFISISMIFIFGFRFVLAIIFNKIILSFCRDIQVSLRSDLMKSYQNMPYEEFIENDSSDAISNTTVLTMYFTNNVLFQTLKAFAEIILAFFLFCFLVFVNGTLVLILSLGLAFLVTLYGNFFKSRMIAYGQGMNMANASLVQAVKQSMQGIKEVRVLGKEEFFYEKYISNARRYGDLHAKSILINTGTRYFMEFAIIGFFVLAISASNILMPGDTTNVFSTIGVFGFAAIRLLPGVNIITSAILQLRAQKNTVDRLHKAVEKLESSNFQSEILTKGNDSNNKVNFESIILKNIQYAYPGSRDNALKNINLEILKGESIGIIGPSGSGKTSLIDILLGLLEPKSGEIIINGKPFNDIKKEWRSMTAYIPQESLMINDTLSTNIQLDKDSPINNDLVNSIDQAQLKKVVDFLPNGLQTNLGESGVRLSGGQRQRVALARAIFHSRDVLVFDEATSALDSDTENEVVKEITRMKGIKTMIIVAHRTNTLRYCDRIYKIDDGLVVDFGTPEEILGLL